MREKEFHLFYGTCTPHWYAPMEMCV